MALRSCLPCFLYVIFASFLGASEITVVVDAQKTFPIKRNLWGVNNNNLFVPYGYRDEVFIREAAPLHFSLIRFPGGSEANAYEWETGSFAPWFYKKIETSSSLFPKTLSFDEKGIVKNENLLRADDFIAYCLREKKSPIVTLNVFGGIPKAVALLKFFEEKKLGVAYAEMGNEIYYLGYEKWTGDTSESAKKITSFYRGIKKEFPNLILSLPVGGNHRGSADISGNPRSASAGGGDDPDLKRQVLWNQVFRELDCYDAVSVHHYLSYFLTKGDLEILNAKLKSGKDIESVYDYLGSEATFAESELAELFQPLYPKKKMILSEWGVLNSWDPVLFQSWAHALFVFDFLQNLLRSERPWDAACYHILTGRIFELFSYDLVSDGGAKKWDTSKMIRRMPYYTLALIGEALEDSSQGLKLLVKGSPEREGSLHYGGRKWPLVNVTGFLSKDGRSVNLLVVSRDGQPHQLKIEGGNPVTKITIKGYSSKKLSNSYGGPNLGTGYQDQGLLEKYENVSEGAQRIEIPKYFAGWIKAEIQSKKE